MKSYDVCVIGAGASGMAAAISASKRGLRVIIVDKNKKCGTKLYATGNGKCNLANTYLDQDCYYKNSAALQILEAYPYHFITKYMENLGVPTYEKSGYIYPVSNQASTVVWALSDALNGSGVEILYKCEIVRISGDKGHYTAFDNEGCPVIRSKAVILATGGVAAPMLGAADKRVSEELFSSLPISYRPFRPALCPVLCKGEFRDIAGVRTKANISLFQSSQEVKAVEVDFEHGELQITEYGLSGIAIFDLSSNIALCDREEDGYFFQIDVLPGYVKEEIVTDFENVKKSAGTRTILAFLNGYINDKLAKYFLDRFSSEKGEDFTHKKLSEVTKESISELVLTMKQWMVSVERLYGHEKSQASAGGIPVSEIDFNTMQLKEKPGIYAVGEAVDVLGRCGGYNLMWAFVSGHIAGEHV